MTLIDNWRLVWKFYSTHALFIASIMPIAMTEAAKYFDTEIPVWLKAVIAGFIFVSGLVGRMIVQVPANQVQDNVDDPK